jgi:hypothetical protein
VVYSTQPSVAVGHEAFCDPLSGGMGGTRAGTGRKASCQCHYARLGARWEQMPQWNVQASEPVANPKAHSPAKRIVFSSIWKEERLPPKVAGIEDVPFLTPKQKNHYPLLSILSTPFPLSLIRDF